MWKAHAELLKMAKTEEKRERIKWFAARSAFFGAKDFAKGLAMARECQQVDDARFLVSLFTGGPPASAEEAVGLFLSRRDDARCLCWAARLGAEPSDELMRESAERGYAWGQAAHARSDDGVQRRGYGGMVGEGVGSGRV